VRSHAPRVAYRVGIGGCAFGRGVTGRPWIETYIIRANIPDFLSIRGAIRVAFFSAYQTGRAMPYRIKSARPQNRDQGSARAQLHAQAVRLISRLYACNSPRSPPGWCRVVRNVRARVQHAPRIHREAVVFRGPPDMSGPVLSTSMCAAKAYETRAALTELSDIVENVTPRIGK